MHRRVWPRRAPLVGFLWFTIIGSLLAGSCGHPVDDRPEDYLVPRIDPNFSIQPLLDFDEFPVYWTGERYAGLELVRVDIEPPAESRTWNMVRLMYGQCRIDGGDGGCAPPLLIETIPACAQARVIADKASITSPAVSLEVADTYRWTSSVAVYVQGALSARDDLVIANTAAFPGSETPRRLSYDEILNLSARCSESPD